MVFKAMRLDEVIRCVSTDREEAQRLCPEHFNFKQLATSNGSTWGYMLIREQLAGNCCFNGGGLTCAEQSLQQ